VRRTRREASRASTDKPHNENSPVKRYHDESENAGSNGHVCHEVVDGTIYHSKGPMRVKKKDKVEGAVEQ